MHSDKEPIIAKASAAGRGGIGVVRISGSTQALAVLARELFAGRQLPERHASLLAVRDALGRLIDRAIVIRFAAPRSYTGEEVIEIQAHGGSAVQQLIVDRCLELGRGISLRQAEPGEFSQRAFLNGRMDLVQAEAVADLIEASSASAARAAARSMQGEFSRRVKAVNDELVELRAYIEATMDFPEEEIDFIENGYVNERVEKIAGMLDGLNRSAMRGKVLRDGLTVVLVGSPNVGKSSLMNALAGDEVAIVTDVAGTTRDRIAYNITLDGLSVNLIDTAGVRLTQDPVEQIGIQRTLEAVEGADVVLHLRSVESADTEIEQQALALIRPRLREGVQFIDVLNKIDLLPHPDDGAPDGIRLSVKTGSGMETLIERLKNLAAQTDDGAGEFLARSRHLDCLARAREHIRTIQQAPVGTAIGLDIAAEELRIAGLALGEIIGQTLPDDLLGMIFSRFCIGK